MSEWYGHFTGEGLGKVVGKYNPGRLRVKLIISYYEGEPVYWAQLKKPYKIAFAKSFAEACEKIGVKFNGKYKPVR